MKNKELAVNGGRPVRDTFLPASRECLDEADISAVVNVLRRGNLCGGELVAALEERFAGYAGVRYAVAVSSGGAGLHITAAAAGISLREEVIVSSLSPLADACFAKYMGGGTVFADIDTHTYNVDPVEVRHQLTPGTRAIVAAHYAGQPCDLEAIHGLARENGLTVVEDASCALGAEYQGRRVGALSDMTVFSFERGEGPVAGGGGMVTTGSEELYQWLKVFRSNGVVSDPRLMIKNEGPWYFEMQELGFPYRMTELQAALGLSQLAKAGAFLRRREEIAERYNRAFAGMKTLAIPEVLPGVRPAWTMYVLSLRLERLAQGRSAIYDALRAENIGVAVPDPPLHRHPFFIWQGHKDVCTLEGSLCPRADDLYETFLLLPVYPALTDGDVTDVIQAVYKVLDNYSDNL